MSERVGVGMILRVPEFRALWIAEAQSLVGDQLARVALVVLAYARTGSPAITGLIYALTFVPAIVGGATLSGLADRFPRRTVMVWCDVIRAGLVATMALPGLPLAAVSSLLVLAVLAGRPFAAGQLALLPEVLPGESFVVGAGLRMVTDQVAQLAGFASGGLIVAAIGARNGLLVDAATFVVSAVILRAFLRHRPAATSSDRAVPAHGRSGQSLRATLVLVMGEPRRRALLGLGCLAAFHVVPEGVAPAYADSLGAGAAAVGVLMAALPFGTAVGAFVLVRLRPDQRSRLLGPLALATAVPLIVCSLEPGLVISTALWTLCGLFAAYQVEASASFVASLPNHQRGRAVGLASSAMIAAQGIGVIVFGVVADRWGAANAVAFAGVASFALAVPLAAGWVRSSRTPPNDRPASLRQVGKAQPQIKGDG